MTTSFHLSKNTGTQLAHTYFNLKQEFKTIANANRLNPKVYAQARGINSKAKSFLADVKKETCIAQCAAPEEAFAESDPETEL
ncbi:hypothetical protein HGRIS_003129 [Hohenbuehelia grisea]|uniref:Uncharacterized protein n=1 Tax=Hohenbuehelia grisea TaxID=104357 RepID=A0ABR3JNS7_9AGAR